MRITILQGPFLPIPPVSGGAVEKLWFQLGQEFAQLGHLVVHISRSFNDFPNLETINHVQHRRVRGYRISKYFIISNILDLIYTLRVLFVLPRADILISNTFWMPFLQPLLAPYSGRLVVSVERMPKGQHILYPSTSLFRCCSSAVKQRLIRQYRHLASKTVVIANPLPFSLPLEAIPQVKLNRIIYCGRIHPEKGLNLLIRAYSLACENGLRGWELRIIGPWEVSQGGGGESWYNSLKDYSTSQCGSITWLGPIFDDLTLHDEYHASSLFVYPSMSDSGEAMPLAPLEAMAFGSVPILASLDCYRDYVTHNINGLFFDHRSSSPHISLAETIVDIARRPDHLSFLSSNALKVRHSHHPSMIATELVDAFRLLDV